MIEQAQHVAGEIAEIERPVIVVRLAVAARVPGDRVELLGEDRDLVVPVGAVAADAVHEQDQRPLARMVEGDARLAGNVVGGP